VRPQRIEPGPGQESVWDYPRPPDVRAGGELIVVAHGGVELARSISTRRVCETSQPPAYYIDRADIAMSALVASPTQSFCEWKGVASYWSLQALSPNGEPIIVDDIAWCYERPAAGFESIVGRLAFYAQRLDHCSVDGEVVEPNPGSFYGGWITSKVTGPFKGGTGTLGW
jgi:uncharacterized protein (DUF427 family)